MLQQSSFMFMLVASHHSRSPISHALLFLQYDELVAGVVRSDSGQHREFRWPHHRRDCVIVKVLDSCGNLYVHWLVVPLGILSEVSNVMTPIGASMLPLCFPARASHEWPRGEILHNSHIGELHDDVTPLAALVYWKGHSIYKEFEDLLMSKWDILNFAFASEAVDFRGMLMFLIGVNAADYYRRVIGVIEAYPLRLFWLVRCRHNEACQERQTVAKELLTGTPLDSGGKVDQNSGRLKQLFGQELAHAAETGLLEPRLHFFLLGVRRQFRADSQEQEGKNKDLQGTRL